MEISSRGFPDRLGDAALRFCLSWFRFGGPLDRFWDHLGPILAPTMAPKLDFGRILAPKMAPKSDLGQILASKMDPFVECCLLFVFVGGWGVIVNANGDVNANTDATVIANIKFKGNVNVNVGINANALSAK